MNIISNLTARSVFDNARKAIEDAGISLQKAVLSQSYLRSEIAISTTQASYHVPVLINDNQNGNPFNTERRLNLQDAFVVSEVGVFLAVPSGVNDATFLPLTYPDPVKFSTANAAADAQTLYNGWLRLIINQKVIVPYWDIARHYKAPITQDGVGITAQTVFPTNDSNLCTDGVYPTEPNWVISGSKQIDFTLNLPAAIGVAQANSRIIILQRGVLAQNSTSVY